MKILGLGLSLIKYEVFIDSGISSTLFGYILTTDTKTALLLKTSLRYTDSQAAGLSHVFKI